ncbi:MAG: DUF3530 family protein [Gammaproteobacteria bacterium]|nr:MAG: DUF3530 family protein [Gammaproteobacteria bacterium]
MRYTLYKLLLIVLLSSFLTLSHADSKSDQGKEKRWEEQIVPSLMVGEEIKLKANGVEFLALYAEASSDKPKGAVMLLHGIGVHPAWPDVIEPLRAELPELGWHTLSLQMPVLHNEATIKDYPPLFPEVPGRIQAGIDFLKANGIDMIVLSGHSLGATMATYYLSTSNDPAVKGFAILSSGEGFPKNELTNSLEHFKNIKVHYVIDVYGSEDEKHVLKAIQKREALGKKQFGNNYQHIKVDGANHFYRDKENELIGIMDNWLNKQFVP